MDTRAHVRPSSKCQLVNGIAAGHIKLMRIWEFASISVRSAIKHDCTRFSGKRNPVHVVIGSDIARKALDGRLEPKDLIDGVWNKKRRLAYLVPFFGVLGEQPDAAGDTKDR